MNWSPRSPSLENIFSSAKQSVLLKLGPTGQKHNNSHQKSDGAVNNVSHVRCRNDLSYIYKPYPQIYVWYIYAYRL